MGSLDTLESMAHVRRPAGWESVLPRRLFVRIPQVRWWTVSGFATLPAVLLWCWRDATEWAVYDRGRIAGGELWRLITGHWTHWTSQHLGWDVLAFAVLLPLCWIASRRRTCWTLASACVLIPAVIFAALPQLVEYRGLSGLDSALFVMLATTLLRREWNARAWPSTAVFAIALVGFAVKLGFELSTGQAVFVESNGFVPVPLAHIVGGLCGVAAALKGDRCET